MDGIGGEARGEHVGEHRAETSRRQTVHAGAVLRGIANDGPRGQDGHPPAPRPDGELQVRQVVRQEAGPEVPRPAEVGVAEKEASRARTVDPLGVTPVIAEAEARPVADEAALGPPPAVAEEHRDGEHGGCFASAEFPDRPLQEVVVEARVVVHHEDQVVRPRTQGRDPGQAPPQAARPPEVPVPAHDLLAEGIAGHELRSSVGRAVVDEDEDGIGVTLPRKAVAEGSRHRSAIVHRQDDVDSRIAHWPLTIVSSQQSKGHRSDYLRA